MADRDAHERPGGHGGSGGSGGHRSPSAGARRRLLLALALLLAQVHR